MESNRTANILVIDYSELRAGDIILAASGPQVWKGGAADFTMLRLDPTPKDDLWLYHDSADGRSILVVEGPDR